MQHIASTASALLLLTASAARSQSLIVNLTLGTTETYAIVDIGSVTFPSGQMSVNFNDATSAVWPITDVRSYAFEGLTTNIGAERPLQAVLQASPNPSGGAVRITLCGAGAQHARIDLVDLTGRSLEFVFDGPLPANGLNIEHVTTLASGPCLVRAVTSAGTIVLPLTVQR